MFIRHVNAILSLINRDLMRHAHKNTLLLLWILLCISLSFHSLEAQKVGQKTIQFKIANLQGNDAKNLTGFLQPGNILFSVAKNGSLTQPMANNAKRLTLTIGTSYTLKIISKNKTILEQKITINAATPAILILQLKQVAQQTSKEDINKLKELKVRTGRISPKDSKQILLAAEIRFLPGSSGDALRALENLPGVVLGSGVVGGSLYIRGGNQEDVIYTLDGFRIGNPYHQLGLNSIFPVSAVSSVDFYPGAYFSEYGGVQGANININSKRPSNDFSAEFDVALASVTYFFSVPIIKDKLFLTSSGRRSYYDFYLSIAKLIAPDFPNFPPPYYFDNYYKLEWNIGKGQTLSAIALAKQDTIRIAATVPLTNEAGKTNQVFIENEFVEYWSLLGISHTWENSLFNNQINVSQLFTKNNTTLFGTKASDKKTYRYAVEDKITINLHENLKLQTGAEYVYGTIQDANLSFNNADSFQYSIDTANAKSDVARIEIIKNFLKNKGTLQNTEQEPQSSTSTHLSFEWDFFNISIIPGVRANYQFNRQIDTPYYIDPRIAISYLIMENVNNVNYWNIFTRIGQYSQVPQLFQSSQGGVTARANFTPFIDNPLSYHYIAGTDIDLPLFNIKVEGYYQDGRKQILANPLYKSTDKETKQNAANINTGKSRNYGVELLLKRNFSKTQYGWLSYTYSDAKRYDYISGTTKQKWAYFNNDNTHLLNLVYSYSFSKAFRLGTRLRYSSGTPRSPQHIAFRGDVNRNRSVDANELFYITDFENANTLRNPFQIRWDVRFDWIFEIFGKEATLYVDVWNFEALFYPNVTGYSTSTTYLKKGAIKELNLTIDKFRNGQTVVVPDSKLLPQTGLPLLPLLGFQMYF